MKPSTLRQDLSLKELMLLQSPKSLSLSAEPTCKRAVFTEPVGLVPSESSSGEGRQQGSITKTGNTHARRLLVEAAWHHRRPYRPTKTMRDRWDLAPAAARARGHAGNQRLHERWVRFNERKKRTVIANVAVARELAGWCWSLAVLEGPTRTGRP